MIHADQSRRVLSVIAWTMSSLLSMGCLASADAAEQEHRLKLHEPLGRDWPAAWVSLSAELPPGAFRPEEILVQETPDRYLEHAVVVPARHADGSARAVTAWVYTPLKADETKTFRLVRGGPLRRPPLCRLAEADENAVTLVTDTVEVRVPNGQHDFGAGRPAGEVPAPIISLRRPGHEWLTAGAWADLPPIRSLSTRIEIPAPHRLCHETHYGVADQGEYVVRITLTAREPAILVEEDFQGVKGGGFRLDLLPGLEPTMGQGRFHRPTGPKRNAPGRGRDGYPLDFNNTDGCQVQPFYAWWDDFSVYWSAYRPGGEYVGIFATKPSEWLHPQSNRIQIRTGPPQRVDAFFPLNAGTRRWGLVLAETDQALARSPGGANLVQQCMIRLCENPLDRVKDLALRWPESDNIRYPHLLCHPEDVPAIRKRAQTHPLYQRVLKDHPQAPNDPAGLWLATGDEQQAKQAIAELSEQLIRWREVALDGDGYLCGDMVAIPFTRPVRRLALVYDLVAASESMTPAQRDWCLRQFAFLAYCLRDDNRWPPGNQGFHRGNINFHSDDYTCVAAVVGLLSGHPDQRRWMDYVEHHLRAEFDRCVSPGGAWCEAPNYQAYTMHYLMIAMRIMQLNGFADFAREPRFRQTMDFLFRIQTPYDVRAGMHMLPTVGDTSSYYHSQSLQNVFAWAAALFRDDPEMAGRMMYAWRRGGSVVFGAHGLDLGAGWVQPLLMMDPGIPEVPPDRPLTSEQLPGYGAVFRNNWGTDRESYCLFKMGPIGQHYDADEGSFHWYALGRPISLDFGCMYSPSIEQPWLHSTIDFDRQRIWTQGDVDRFASFDEFDYCVGRCDPTHFQKQALRPGEPDAEQQVGPLYRREEPMHWQRQILFVKGADYLVMRDVLDDPLDRMATGWTVQVMAAEARVDGALARFIGQHGVDLDVLVAEPADVKMQTSTWGHEGKHCPDWVLERPMPAMGEQQIALRVENGPDRGYLAALFPYEHRAALPQLRRLADGVLGISYGGTEDIVFFKPEPGETSVDGITFVGRVAIVRRDGETTEIMIAEGDAVRTADASIYLAAPASIRITANSIRGNCDGDARTCEVVFDERAHAHVAVALDGQPVERKASDRGDVLSLPAGRHTFAFHYE